MTDDDKPAFVQAFTRLAIATRAPKPDALELRTYFDALASLPVEFVAAAAERLALGDFFPKLGEWRAAAITVERERQESQRAALRRLREPLCPVCRDTGWELLEGDRVRRCACVTERRLEVIGHRALPSVPVIDVEPVAPEQATVALSKVERETGTPIRIRPMPKVRLPVEDPEADHD